jgi:very-short-patch-repair endonuclease
VQYESAISRVNPVPASRQLRKKQTWAEKALWRLLRDRHFSGYKFRRQHPVGEYSLDFYCAEARLALETDGFGHGFPVQQRHDVRREEFLRSQGILVKRIWNWQLRRELEWVRYNLWKVLQERAPQPGNVPPARRVTARVLNPDKLTPHPNPLPVQPGEGEQATPLDKC